MNDCRVAQYLQYFIYSNTQNRIEEDNDVIRRTPANVKQAKYIYNWYRAQQPAYKLEQLDALISISIQLTTLDRLLATSPILRTSQATLISSVSATQLSFVITNESDRL